MIGVTSAPDTRQKMIAVAVALVAMLVVLGGWLLFMLLLQRRSRAMERSALFEAVLLARGWSQSWPAPRRYVLRLTNPDFAAELARLNATASK